MLYGLAGYANESDLYYNSNNAFVKTYTATNQGKLDVKYSSALPNGTSYAMTMLFGPKTSTEFSTEWVTRAYAKLADGSVVYSDASHYTIVNIAKKLYDGCKMQNKEGHEYLYNNIITKLYPNYAEVDYDWGGGIVS